MAEATPRQDVDDDTFDFSLPDDDGRELHERIWVTDPKPHYVEIVAPALHA